MISIIIFTGKRLARFRFRASLCMSRPTRISYCHGTERRLGVSKKEEDVFILIIFERILFQIFLYLCQQVFRARTPTEAMELVARLLEYTPSFRMTPLQACAHSFFDELREQGTRLPNGRELPPLFNFTEHELQIQPTLNSILIPKYMQTSDNPGAQSEATNVAAGASGNSSDNTANISTPTTTQNTDPSQSNMA